MVSDRKIAVLIHVTPVQKKELDKLKKEKIPTSPLMRELLDAWLLKEGRI